MRLVLVFFASFWVWETVRFAVEQHLPAIYTHGRAAHPVVAAIFPLVVLWPDWVEALAVAAAVGLLHLFVLRALGVATPPQVVAQRRPRRGGLPPLP